MSSGSHVHITADDIEVRNTVEILMILLQIFLLGVLIFAVPFGLIWSRPWMLLGLALWLVIVATQIKTFTRDVAAFETILLLNELTKKMRAVRKGFQLVLPWESDVKVIDSRVHPHEVLNETYTSKVGQILARYVYSMSADTSTDLLAANYASYDEDTIKQAGRALFSALLSDYFRDKEKDEDILNKTYINALLFGENPSTDQEKKYADMIHEFQHKYSVDVVVRLEDVDFNASVQRARDTIGKARSISEAIVLLKNDGMTQAAAEKMVRLSTFENTNEHIFSVDAPDLKNLQNFSILGGIPGGGKK